jgi:hypothetical protein
MADEIVSSEEVAEELKLMFTGKAALIIDLEGFGPMEFSFNDHVVLQKIVRIMLDELGELSTVNSYDDNMESVFRGVMDRIPSNSPE